MTGKPNVLFVFSDQQRGTDVGYAGNPDVATPNVDRLAGEGRRYPNAYANAPVCGPGRACLLTGQYPQTHGVVANDLPLPTDVPSIGEAFRDAGYRTGYIGKWHLDGVPRNKFTPPGPRRQGFDDFWAAWNCSHDYSNARYFRDSPDPVSIEGYEPIGQTDLALEFLRADDDRPFCLFLSYGPPHAPYGDVPDRYKDQYDPAELSLRPNAELSPPESRARAPSRAYSDERALREDLAGYYAHTTALDEQVGRLLDCLDETGLARETITVYTSDHGDMLGSQASFVKQWPWEESINVPFVVRWPGEIPPGSRDETLLSTVDLAPTLLRAAGIDPPDAMEGTDLSPHLRGEGGDSPDSVFIGILVPHVEGVSEWRGVRTARYTYARTRHGEPWLLYDTQEDPYQLHNVALQEAYRDEREALDRQVDAWLDRTDDPFLDAHGQLAAMGLVDAWNERERTRNPDDPDLVG